MTDNAAAASAPAASASPAPAASASALPASASASAPPAPPAPPAPAASAARTAPAPFSGAQYVLDNGTARARIGSVAAVLRELRVGGVRVTETVPLDTVPPSGCGMVLAPWPNRVRGGRWHDDAGEQQQLDLTDPGFGGATHGLLRNTAYRLREQTPDAVTLGALVAPQHGWPFLLDTWVRYALESDGLTVTHGVTNLGGRRAPWAVGAHPYFRVGEAPIADLTVTVAGAVRLELDDVRIPVATVPVDGTDHDLRAGRRVGDILVDTAFGELGLGPDGGVAASLVAPDGSRVDVWHGPDFGWTQVYAPTAFPRPESDGGTGLAIALEPMTAAPDALNSGAGLRWIEPGGSWEGSWAVHYRAAPSGPRERAAA